MSLWEAKAGEMTASADYLPTHQYKIVVKLGSRELSETIPATWEPRFGVDTADQAEICEVAERLAKKLESREGP